MHKGFFEQGFMAYLGHRFPSVFEGTGGIFTRELVENLIRYAHQYEHISKDQFCYFLSDLLPEVEFGEVAAFMEDDCLTSSYGLVEKRRVMEEMDIRIEADGEIFHVFVEGKELYL
jgi:hypothetical protein